MYVENYFYLKNSTLVSFVKNLYIFKKTNKFIHLNVIIIKQVLH